MFFLFLILLFVFLANKDSVRQARLNRDLACLRRRKMEAVLAAVCLDGGMEAARGVVERCWPAEDEVARPLQDAKGALQEILQKDGGESPTYEITGQSGPPHAPVFRAAVFRDGVRLAEGEGNTKKAAEQAAALAALKKVKP